VCSNRAATQTNIVKYQETVIREISSFAGIL
jgi:hypothetical protein